jgi:hypothetical protein
MTDKWDSLPELVTAGVSFFALVAAVWAAIAASGQLRELKKDSKDRARQDEQSQASLVAVWLDRLQSGEFTAMCVNASRLPVYELTIGFVNPKLSEPQLIRQPIMPPLADHGYLSDISDIVNSAAANDPGIAASWMLRTEAPVPLETLVTQADGSERWEATSRIGPIGITISFTDAENRRWHRDVFGRLSRVSDDFQIVRSAVMFRGPAFDDLRNLMQSRSSSEISEDVPNGRMEPENLDPKSVLKLSRPCILQPANWWSNPVGKVFR